MHGFHLHPVLIAPEYGRDEAFHPTTDNRLQSEKIFIVFGSMRFLAQLLSFELLLLGSGAPNFLLPTTL
jgi:hypothetical protein